MKDPLDRFLDQMREAVLALMAQAREEGREEVRAMVQGLVTTGRSAPARKGPARKAEATAKPPAKKKRKNPWKSMTPEQREARVRKMLAGRGLKPKPKGKGPAKPKKKRKNPCANMTPQQREARVKKMLAARGLKPKKK